MKTAEGSRNIVVVGDTPMFGNVVAAILGDLRPTPARIRHTTYAGFSRVLTPRVLHETDLFLLEIWRTYPTGLRAEGVAVAEKLIQQTALPLVISSLTLGAKVDLAWYWDLGSEDTLPNRCQTLMRTNERVSLHGVEGLRLAVTAYAAHRLGHDVEGNSSPRGWDRR